MDWGDDVQELHLQLYTAIETRCIKNIKVIIDKLCELSSSQPSSNYLNFYSHIDHLQSPLLHAIAKGQPDASLYLLEKGCKPFCDSNVKLDKHHEKPTLSKCIIRLVEKPGFESVVMHLLDLSEDVVTCSNQETFLHVICRKKLTVFLKFILASSVHSQMLFIPDKQGFLPMHTAAKYNFKNFFRLVFAVKFSTPHNSCDEVNCNNIDPLSARSHVTQETNVLIPEGVAKSLNINARVKWKKLSVLHIAARERHSEIVELCVARGSDVHSSAEGSKTSLMECLDVRGDVRMSNEVVNEIYQVCEILIQAGASVNACGTIPYSQRRSMANDDTVTPLHLAAGLGSSRVVELLLNNGSEATALSKYMGRIPLHFAVEKGHNECVETLLSYSLYPEGFLTSYMDYAFNTLLHSADKCNDEIFMKLIDLGCPLDRPNVNNLRPLDKAITSRNINFIHILLKRQPHIVNVHLYQDPRATLPLYLAAISKLPLCQILLSYGADIYARAYGKHMAYRKAFRYNRYENAVYLCELMSRPFSISEREELLGHEDSMDEELARRLRKRLDMIPSLMSMCLDAVRQTVIKNKLSFQDLDTLPVPNSVIKALRYQGSLTSSSSN